MHQQRRFRIAISLLVCILLPTEGADKYTDENRPYEFGFNVEIDGNKQQHRHEKKDKDGLIMGEFGFVTADDVYHVTVYATDKEGRFKILSMKNIHLKSSPAPSGPALSARQGHSLALAPSVPAAPAAIARPVTQANAIPQSRPPSQAQSPFKPISLQPPGRSCSSCSLPTTTPRASPPSQSASFAPQNQPSLSAPPSANFAPQNQPNSPLLPASFIPQNQQSFPASPPASFAPQNHQFPAPPSVNIVPQNQPSFSAPPSTSFTSQNQPSIPSTASLNNVQQEEFPSKPLSPQAGQPSYSQTGTAPAIPQSYPQPPSLSQTNYPRTPSRAPMPNAPNSYALSGFEQNPAIATSRAGVPQSFSREQPGEQQYSIGASPAQSHYPEGGPGGRTSKQYTGPEQQFGSNPRGQGPVKPTLVSAQMQIVDKNTDIHALRPGEKQGLPPGLNKNDMTQLLYTFNYTVGFHGHFEEGYRNGAKKGYYFVTGRNGVRTRIDYVADGTGFHPKVSQEVLDLLSDDVPKPETEKDEKYGLKGYEFKWLYYPPAESNAQ